ncbi:hypothetical protein Taro_031074 [Colocasia esculenta]|uniref:Uncharacterized protein n=1 Tax=Colocasia esculenta TaxID=4460 RepID=A0A843VN09_COLES|nr:hypothetical protein [Colocasia esculenta]
MQMKIFREAIEGFAEPSAIAGRERVEGADWHLDNLVYLHYNMRLRVKHLTEDPKQRADVDYDPVDIGFLQDEEDPIVTWVARATTERGEYELDEEADDPEDPPSPNTFLARAIAEATAEEEGDRGNVGQPYSPQFQADPEAEVVLLQMLEVAVVVIVEVEVVTVVREEEMLIVLREEEVVGWHSQRSNFFGVQHKILVMVLHCSTIEGRSLVVAVMQEVLQ